MPRSLVLFFLLIVSFERHLTSSQPSNIAPVSQPRVILPNSAAESQQNTIPTESQNQQQKQQDHPPQIQDPSSQLQTPQLQQIQQSQQPLQPQQPTQPQQSLQIPQTQQTELTKQRSQDEQSSPSSSDSDSFHLSSNEIDDKTNNDEVPTVVIDSSQNDPHLESDQDVDFLPVLEQQLNEALDEAVRMTMRATEEQIRLESQRGKNQPQINDLFGMPNLEDREQGVLLKTPDGGEMKIHVSKIYAHQHADGAVHFSRYNPLSMIVHGNHVHSAEEMINNSSYIFLIMLLTVIASQIGLILWKRIFPRSFDLCALAGLFIIPFLMAAWNGFIRFLFIWLLFTCGAVFVIARVRQKPMLRNTPRLVYKYFEFLYRVCYAVAATGYFIFICDFLGLTSIFFSGPLTETAILCLFYGLYFGVTSRDLAAVVSDTLHNKIGYFPVRRKSYKRRSMKDGSKGDYESDNLIPSKTIPSNICPICDEVLYASVRNMNATPVNTSPVNEESLPTIKLNCNHIFHSACIRGWALVGKHDICPQCNEKVPLQSVLTTPWQKTVIAFAFVLDATRYLIVFNPVVMFLAHWASVLLY